MRKIVQRRMGICCVQPCSNRYNALVFLLTRNSVHKPPILPNNNSVEKPLEEAAASAEAMGCVLTDADWWGWRMSVEVVSARRVEREKARENFIADMR
jgi:hypothetical protein